MNTPQQSLKEQLLGLNSQQKRPVASTVTLKRKISTGTGKRKAVTYPLPSTHSRGLRVVNGKIFSTWVSGNPDRPLKLKPTPKPAKASPPTIVYDRVPAALAWLIDTYPAAFKRRRGVRALKVGIIKDILQRDIGGHSRKSVRKAVNLYCWNSYYIRGLLLAGNRIDLKGKVAGVITTDQQEHAAMVMRKREKAKQKSRPLILPGHNYD